MTSSNNLNDGLVNALKDRAKELNCLYAIEEILNNSNLTIDEAFAKIVDTIPQGLRYPKDAEVRISYRQKSYKSEKFKYTPWLISEPINVQETEVGSVAIVYTVKKEEVDIGPFSREEDKLVKTIADRLGHYSLHQDLKNIFMDLKIVKDKQNSVNKPEWRVVVDLIRKVDPNLFLRLTRKLLHTLVFNEVEEAEVLLKQSSLGNIETDNTKPSDENKPLKKKKLNNYDEYIEAILKLAGDNIRDEEIYYRLTKWFQEANATDLVRTVESRNSSLSEISDAIRKYYLLAPEKFELSKETIKGLRVSLLRRFFTEDLEFIKTAKEYVKLTDFYRLIDKMIFASTSHGKLGGKSSGLFLAASVLNKLSKKHELLKGIKIPKTWYIASDAVLAFMYYNNIEEALDQKYKEIDEVRMEYSHNVQIFKNSDFPPELLKGLSMALDDFGDRPLVVRSSSLLEDQMGASFSGKYKSLFLANQGTKEERLSALTDAVAEVYASTFGPDPIEYRSERGLLDFHEEMAIMIMEVVGNKVGNYFLPTFAGVAFSNNEFRWSPRIKREDGLIRLVPGLGTRAVDRTGDDYPVLITPGQPDLRVNITIDEIMRYSPKKIDVINLKTNEFETIEIEELLKESGDEFIGSDQVVSKIDGGMIRESSAFNLDFEHDDLVVTFNGLLKKSNFIKKAKAILDTLEDSLKTPVDIEFASDGKDFYLLQCRPQSFSSDIAPDPIPQNVPEEKILFSANKFISNGKVPQITHIVYVDPIQYSGIKDEKDLLEIGRVVGKLNKILPRRKFILMGPGRWGSRGDIKLGVNVTYSDINNTSLLVEIAKQKGNYVPDLSFGTHFFQDLVEASIRYLPLYPDDKENKFNYNFFNNAENVLESILPEFEYLKEIIKVIDVRKCTNGLILKVLFNAELEEGIGILAVPDENISEESPTIVDYTEHTYGDHWKWRMKMAETIAAKVDMEKFGVNGIYLYGSTKDNTARANSDINLLLHINETKYLEELKSWFLGWGEALSEINYLRTGYKTENLLDIQFITDEDIKNKTSYAVKIGAITDAAKLIKGELP